MRKTLKLLGGYARNEQGGMSHLFAIGLLLTGLTTGVAVDLQQKESKKRDIQALLDNATLASARALQNASLYSADTDDSGAEPYQLVGKEAFNFDNRLSAEEIGALDFTLNADGTEVLGRATIKHASAFGGITGTKNSNLSVRSTVGVAIPDSDTNTSAHACIIALDDRATPGVLINSGAKIYSDKCEMHIHSTRNNSFIRNGNSVVDVPRICNAGHDYTDNGKDKLTNVETSCDVMDDPFADIMPVVDATGCDYPRNNYNATVVTLSPGIYCGHHNFNSGNKKVVFNPGLYVIKDGGWNVNGAEWDAEGVTFYFADKSKIQFNSGVEATITAPKSGPYAGVAFFEAPNLKKSNFILNDSRDLNITGHIHLPSRHVIYNSGSVLRAREMSFVVKSMIFNNTVIDLSPTEFILNAGENSTTQTTAEARNPIIVN